MSCLSFAHSARKFISDSKILHLPVVNDRCYLICLYDLSFRFSQDNFLLFVPHFVPESIHPGRTRTCNGRGIAFCPSRNICSEVSLNVFEIPTTFLVSVSGLNSTRCRVLPNLGKNEGQGKYGVLVLSDSCRDRRSETCLLLVCEMLVVLYIIRRGRPACNLVLVHCVAGRRGNWYVGPGHSHAVQNSGLRWGLAVSEFSPVQAGEKTKITFETRTLYGTRNPTSELLPMQLSQIIVNAKMNWQATL